jgi:hypothetical protein
VPTGTLTEAIRKLGDSTAFDTLAAFLHTKRAKGRGDVVYALTSVSPRRSVPVLVSLLSDTSGGYLDESTVSLLGTLGDSSAVEPLKKVLDHGPGRTPLAAARALVKIGTASANDAVTAYLKRTGEIASCNGAASMLATRNEPWAEAMLVRLAYAEIYDPVTQSSYLQAPSPFLKHAAELRATSWGCKYLQSLVERLPLLY